MSANTAVVEEVLERYAKDPTSLIMVLQDIQAELNYIPEEGINKVAQELAVPRSRIYSVASFYKALSLEQRGKHHVDVCMGTACHVRGAGLLVDQVARELGVNPGQTTEDKEFTFNTVNCVGACAMGPVVVMDGEYHGEMKPGRVGKALKECCSREKGEAKSECKCETAAKQEVKRLGNAEELVGIRKELIAEKPLEMPGLLVCAGPGCLANGSLKVAEALEQELAKQGGQAKVELQVKKTGCHGFCEKGPLVVMHPSGTYYTKVKVEDAAEIVEKTVLNNEVVERLLYRDTKTDEVVADYKDIPFYSRQEQNVLGKIGLIDPDDIGDYIRQGGYGAL
ncbi:MAG: hypothetical protein GY869_04180, partial [Planctomycetes bacterium]|nr:hypothetical protein [Planctomycetota bacterium]